MEKQNKFATLDDVPKGTLVFRVNDMAKNTVDYYLDHCFANVGVGKDEKGSWATVYLIETMPAYRNQGEATRLLKRLKEIYEAKDYRFAVWCPMNKIIEGICCELDIEVV